MLYAMLFCEYPYAVADEDGNSSLSGSEQKEHMIRRMIEVGGTSLLALPLARSGPSPGPCILPSA